MKAAEVTPKLTAIETRFRESLTKLTAKDASDEQVGEAIHGLNATADEIKTLAGVDIEAEVKTEFREADPGKASQLAAENETLKTRLRESEAEAKDFKSKHETGERTLLAAQVLREAEVPAEAANRLFGQLVQLDSKDAMESHLKAQTEYEQDLFRRFQESIGIGAATGVEGARPLVPAGTPSQAPGPERLAKLGIPLKPEQAAA